LLEQELDRLGVSIGTREIAYELRNNPPQYVQQAEVFQNNGQFDAAKYEEFLRNPQATNEIIMLEMDVKARLRQQRLIDQITASAMVSQKELWEDWTDKNTTFKLKYIAFPTENNPADTNSVTEQEVEAEYKARQEEFKIAEQRKVWFVQFSEQPTASDSAHAKEQAYEIYQRAKKGEDFAELAKTYSEDNSAQNGGSVGYFGRGRMVKPFEELAFSTPIDSIAPPVMTQFGWHVIKVTGKKAATAAKKAKKGQPETPAQDEQVEASHVLFKFTASPETKDLIRETAREFAQSLQTKKSDVNVLAKQYNVKLDSSGLFTQQTGSIPKVGRSILATNFAFESKIGEVSFPYYIRNAWFVVGVVEVKAAGVRPLTEVRKQIVDQLVKEKRITKAVQKANEAKGRGANLETIAAASGLKIDTTGTVKARDWLPSVGKELDMTVPAKTAPLNTLLGPARGTRGAYLYTVTERTPADSSQFNSQTMQQTNQIIQKRQQQLYNDYLAKLKKEAKIEDFRYMMYSDF
ncbi:MAG: peptidylprolyl isomerase, partial [bacterium]|nr:peptidylprolyl isomerase [bacterium]